MNERDLDRAVSQTVRAQLALRDLILSGRLRPGERISELGAVETTGVSRTPVHNAVRFDSAAHHMPIVPHHQVTPLVGELMA